MLFGFPVVSHKSAEDLQGEMKILQRSLLCFGDRVEKIRSQRTSGASGHKPLEA